jgi:hypothetical protein
MVSKGSFIMGIMIWALIMGVVVFILVANYFGFLAFLNEPLNRAVSGQPDVTCKVDSDCVISPTTCEKCDCGGLVNKNWHTFCPLTDRSVIFCNRCPSPGNYELKCQLGLCFEAPKK